MRPTGYLAGLLLLALLLLGGAALARQQVLIERGRAPGTARVSLKRIQVKRADGSFATRNMSLTVPAGVAARLAASAPESLTVSALDTGQRTRVRVTAGFGCNTVVIDRDKEVQVQIGAGSCISPYSLTTRRTKRATPIDPRGLGRLPGGARIKPWYATRGKMDEGDPHWMLEGRQRAQSATLVSRLGELGAELSSRPFGAWQDTITAPQRREIHPGIQSAVQTMSKVLHATYTTAPSPLRLKRGELAEYASGTGGFGPRSSKAPPDPARPYREVYVQNRGCTFFTGVSLQIGPGDDLDQLANTLAAGRNARPIAAELRRNLKAGRTEIPLQELLSPFVRDNVGKNPSRALLPRNSRNAPNCFNAALGFHSQRATPRFTEPATFARRLKREYKLLQPGEQIRFGDLVVIWSHGYNHKDVRHDGRVDPWRATPIHAAVYLDRDLLFGKPSNSMVTSHQFESYAGSFAHYLDKSQNRGLITVHRRQTSGE